MKTFFNLIASLLLGIATSNANPVISSFSVFSGNLQSAKIKVNNTGSSDFTAIIAGSRGVNDTNVYLELVFYAYPGSGTVDYPLKTVVITQSNYNNTFLQNYNGQTSNNISIPVTIPNEYRDHQIKLKYRYKDSDGNWHAEVNGYVTLATAFSTINISPLPHTVIFPQTLSIISSLGFETTNAKAYGNYYLVEDDIMLPKSYVDNHSSASAPLTSVTKDNINISLPSFLYSVNGPWYTAFNRAIRAWNTSPNSNIKLNVVIEEFNNSSNAQQVDVSVKLAGDALAVPVVSRFGGIGGAVGPELLINTNTTLSVEQATWNLVQAIGHCLGIRHAKVVGSENSVMRQGTSQNSYASQLASGYDANAIGNIYPLNNNSLIQPFISGKSSWSTNSSQGFNVSYFETGLTYVWWIVGINGTSFSKGYGDEYNDFLPEVGLNPGQYKVNCTISGGKYLSPVTATKNIIVQ